MHKSFLAIVLTCSLAGCASTQPPVARTSMVMPAPANQGMSAQPVRVNPTTSQTSAMPELQPGPNYVASFPEADRRAACVRLKYVENTPKFARCLEGDFPENPYFRG